MILEKWPKEPSLQAGDVTPDPIPVCINKTVSAKTAFQIMAHQNLSCLAVVNFSHPARGLVNQISTRDIRGRLLWGIDHKMGVGQYLDKARRTPYQNTIVSPND